MASLDAVSPCLRIELPLFSDLSLSQHDNQSTISIHRAQHGVSVRRCGTSGTRVSIPIVITPH